MGRWDLYLKLGVRESPQDFVDWLLPGAHFLRWRDGQLQTREVPEGPFAPREIRMDGLMEVRYGRKRFLLHLEFQSTKEKRMGFRLLGYSYEAMRVHNLPVFSCVVYVQHVFKPSQTPYVSSVPVRGKRIIFEFESIELAEMPVEALEHKRLVGLAPLWVLMKGGATREVVERAIALLEESRRPEALAILRLLALLVCEKDAALTAWIEWRFATMQDYLLENSLMYKELVREGRIKGLEEGTLNGIRQSIEMVVQARFPVLLDFAKERMALVQEQSELQRLLVAMSVATTERKARRFLLAFPDNS